MMKILLFLIVSISFSQLQAKPALPVTHEDIRDVILMLVRVMTATEDKLRRHEIRERTLGEHMRKMVVTLDKRIKTLHPVMGTANRLDDRISDVEKILLTNDVKDNSQIEEVKTLLLDIKGSFPQLIEQVKADIIQEIKAKIEPEINSEEEDDSVEEKSLLSTKIDTLSLSIQQIQDELAKLKNEQQNTQQLNNKFDEYMVKFQSLLSDNEKLLRKYENKFEESNKFEVLPQDSSVPNDWQIKIAQALEKQENDVEEVLTEVKNSGNLIQNLEDKLVESMNNSKDSLEDKLIDLTNRTTDDNLNTEINLIGLSLDDIYDKFSQVNYEEINENFAKITNHLNSSGDILQKYESKLAEYDNKFESFTSNYDLQFNQHAKTLQSIESTLEEIKATLGRTKSPETIDQNNLINLQNQTMNLLKHLDESVDENTNGSQILLERIEDMLENGEQMIEFNRKSAQDVIDAVETLNINNDLSFSSLTEEIQALKT